MGLSCCSHADGSVYVELSPQQLPLLDIMRLLRQRRKVEAGAHLFVTDQLKAASAVLTQVRVYACS
jgi:hypothetical protein